jgi:prephenate dehydratase
LTKKKFLIISLNGGKKLKIEGLEKFLRSEEFNGEEIERKLQSKKIQKIACFVLGPPGTNIGQAAEKWAKRLEIEAKTEFIWCKTPEEAVEKTKKVNEDGVLSIFWTCAVYVNEAELFFSNPYTMPFFFIERMNLDKMQLATRLELLSEIKNGKIPVNWKIASHPSPAPLVRNLKNEIVFANSNSQAAELCSQGKAELCITTESARKIYGLKTVFEFGSPPMIFFGGITENGLKLLKKVL